MPSQPMEEFHLFLEDASDMLRETALVHFRREHRQPLRDASRIISQLAAEGDCDPPGGESFWPMELKAVEEDLRFLWKYVAYCCREAKDEELSREEKVLFGFARGLAIILKILTESIEEQLQHDPSPLINR